MSRTATSTRRVVSFLILIVSFEGIRFVFSGFSFYFALGNFTPNVQRNVLHKAVIKVVGDYFWSADERSTRIRRRLVFHKKRLKATVTFRTMKR